MTGRAAVAAAAIVLALVAPAGAAAARYVVGLEPDAASAGVARGLRARGATPVESLAPLPALVVDTADAAALAGVRGVRYVEPLRVRRPAFTPNDPFLPRQWYLAQNRSYDAWTELPPLAAVRVAVIDSGVDATHPQLAGRIAAARSFVGGDPSDTSDTQGHGTFVAGLIAAAADDGVGIAGLAPSAQLLVAKVVGPQRSISVEAEAKAIRWAVARGARVINMSLGGLRDPADASRDTYSRLEADAVAYAVSKGVLVVAAVGNSDQAPSQPWPYASWPAALPHVLGVSALARSGDAPLFSNRDPVFNDVAAPGEEILSTLPLALTAQRPECSEQGYSSCGPDEYRNAEGTSFAAPQVTAAAAQLIAADPSLAPGQAASLIERSAVDATAANGCAKCAPGRDPLTGWGRLDAAAALAAPRPARDAFEPNDGAGASAYPLYGVKRRVDATLDYWDDRDDVYRVYLRRGQALYASYGGATPQVAASLSLWRPGSESLAAAGRPAGPVRRSAAGQRVRISYRAPHAGWYSLRLRLERPGGGAYRLSVVKAS